MSQTSRQLLAVPALILSSAIAVRAQTTEELKRMSLKDLLDIEVTTVSRTPEPTTTVPAAVYVITSEDIQRSGATSIPEALRLAPGVQVARLNAGTWSIGIRGFADRLARSILVLIDGRAVYSPLFAGTYWETQDTLLTDIDRIEVIRGPGGTLWGANAVNGIINIITKRAKDTQGVYASAGGGSDLRGFGGFRYGGSSGNASYRAYAKAVDRTSEFHPDGNDFDLWRSVQAGFRADWTLTASRTFTLQGDLYDARLGEQPAVTSYSPPFSRPVSVEAPLSGGNVVARLGSRADAGPDYQLQVYYDRTNRDEIPVGEKRDTVDVDWQQTIRRWRRHALTWGAGYRATSGLITAVGTSAFVPNRRTDNLYNAFAQDEFALVPDRWRLVVGTKIEHNDYSGVELQPTARVLWTPDRISTVFAAVTRAVRTPSRVETDYTTTTFVTATPLPTFVRLMPDPAFDSEKLVAYELGYRVRPVDQLYVTFSGFYNSLRDTLSTELLTPFVETSPLPPHLVLPVAFKNGLTGDSAGAEATADFRATPWWRITGNYSYLNVAMSKKPGSRDVSQERRYEGLIPHHQAQVTSSFDFVHGISADVIGRHISALAAGPVPGYTTADVRVGLRLSPALEISLVGQDLLQDHHVEWPSGSVNTFVERSVYARVVWRR